MKEAINRILRKFGGEVHGLGYLQSLKKKEFGQDAFALQADMLKGKAVRTIFDVGANRGDVVERYAHAFPEAEICAFEPFPESYQILMSKFGVSKKVKSYQLAVGEEETKLPFYVNKNVDTNSLLRPIKMGLSSDKQVENLDTIEVPCVKLDDFCKQRGVSEIDILKMDIQGGEYGALKGCNDLLRQKKVRLIYLECYFLEQYENQPLFHDISKLLHGFGYYLQDIYYPIYGKGSLAWSDVIFLPR